jgi:hypothetical protein
MFAACFMVIPSFIYLSTLMTEAMYSSEPPVDIHRTTRRYIPQKLVISLHPNPLQGDGLLTSIPVLKLDDHPLSTVRDCSLSILLLTSLYAKLQPIQLTFLIKKGKVVPVLN